LLLSHRVSLRSQAVCQRAVGPRCRRHFTGLFTGRLICVTPTDAYKWPVGTLELVKSLMKIATVQRQAACGSAGIAGVCRGGQQIVRHAVTLLPCSASGSLQQTRHGSMQRCRSVTVAAPVNGSKPPATAATPSAPQPGQPNPSQQHAHSSGSSGHTALLHGLGDVGDVDPKLMPGLLRLASIKSNAADASGGQGNSDSAAAMAEDARGLMAWSEALDRWVD
jgi:hypothetical protein